MMTTPAPLLLKEGWLVSVNNAPYYPTIVPALVTDPTDRASAVTYRNTVTLPEGVWEHCSLLLKGARFCPEILINGRTIAHSEGGMGQLTIPLEDPDVFPGNTVTLEIQLSPLEEVPVEDASRIPDADWWRSNVSSLLWDEVSLSFFAEAELTEAVPFTDFANRELTLRCKFRRWTEGVLPVEVRLTDGDILLAHASVECTGDEAVLKLQLDERCPVWTPESPSLCKLQILYGSSIQSETAFSWALREFSAVDKKFTLNQNPVSLRACTVVWHRLLRDPEAAEIAFDQNWFLENILLRLKSHGGNTIRFHLGPPPEAFLDLCDRYGVLVQMEWSFFHGIRAGYESLVKQWRQFLLTCLRHPSVVLVHLWNETEGDQLRQAFAAMEAASQDLPSIVFSHRDVLHIHKYWWSLFENVGVYYHSADQFPLPIMSDEFGGNYLDGKCEPGKYPTVMESFLRFLGKNLSAADMLQLQNESNARVAEYWRRIGAAGFSPFCALGSPEDGSHHFLGPLRFGAPKPVWDALTAAWAPVSLSLAVWDRNYSVGQRVSIPLYLYNETDTPRTLLVEYGICGEYNLQPVDKIHTLERTLAPYETKVEYIDFTVPAAAGDYQFLAQLKQGCPEVTHPIVSQWRFHAIEVKTPSVLRQKRVSLIDGTPELSDFLKRHDMISVSPEDAPDLVLVHGNAPAIPELDPKIPVVCLQLGPQNLGQGYRGDDLGDLQGVEKVTDGEIIPVSLLDGMTLLFQRVAEPESCIHPSEEGAVLWKHLRKDYGCLWNGMKGGILAPSHTMSVDSLSPDAFLEEWVSRGADREQILSGHCYAYSLEGFYRFTDAESPDAEEELRQKVTLLAEDAPALAHAINRGAKVQKLNLGEAYCRSHGIVRSIRPLAFAGKNLFRTPLLQIELENGRVLWLSQLLTDGRLVPETENVTLPLHPDQPVYDPVCEQFICNLLAAAIE